MFLAHGCGHSALDFFDPSPSCPRCIGLPEEKKIASAALRAQYLVVAVSSSDVCWSHYTDIRPVELVIARLRRLHGSALPLFGLGASSGGYFIGSLPLYSTSLSFAAICIQIMGLPLHLLEREGHGQLTAYPPSLWIHMAKDQDTARAVDLATKALRRRGRTTRKISVPELPITEEFFADRTGCPTGDSESIWAAFLADGVINSSGFLVEDPRQSAWRESILRSPKLSHYRSSALAADQSAISEEMNVAYALHEITSDYMPQILQFFSSAK
jgi:hypothetical protein